jgi:hypothetical protein
MSRFSLGYFVLSFIVNISNLAFRYEYEFDISFSFAGEDRQYVEAVAEELQKCSVRIFYDKYEQANLWGKDLYTYLLGDFGIRFEG